MNIMRELRIEKVTLNICAGKDKPKLEKGIRLLQTITGMKPIQTVTQKRLAAWGLRPGLPIGCKVTLRNESAKDVLKRLISAKDNRFSEKQFDTNGNFAFGIHECIDIPEYKYDPDIGIMGLEVCVTFERPGFRIKRRKTLKKKVPKRHKITKQESIQFMKKEFNISLGEESDL